MATVFKTNVMRILDKAKVSYQIHEYSADDGAIDGLSIVRKVGVPAEKVYKTLVTKGAKDYFVFVIPVEAELDLKAAARAVGEKAVAMIAVKDLLKVTGYIRGGCSPIGMKKEYRTTIDESCRNLETMLVSAGKIGHQIEIAPTDLLAQAHAQTAEITQK